MSNPQLATELETYESHKAELVAEHLGKYVVIRGVEILGTWETYPDALKAGYETCGLEPFLVKRIEEVDSVHFFTRDLTCRS